jgi:hypothetical protein
MYAHPDELLVVSGRFAEHASAALVSVLLELGRRSRLKARAMLECAEGRASVATIVVSCTRQWHSEKVVQANDLLAAAADEARDRRRRLLVVRVPAQHAGSASGPDSPAATGGSLAR